MKIWKRLFMTSSGIGLLLVGMIAINIISSRLFFRGDLTQDKVYSLSEGTRNILSKLSNEVTFQLYFSKSSPELPVMIKTYASRVEEVLREYAARSGGKITVEVYDPKPDSDEEVWARRYGMSPVRLPSGAEMYFGVALLYGGKDVAIPYLDPRREEFLEYDVSEALLQTQSATKLKIGIASSLPVIGGGGSPFMGGGGSQTWAFVEQLKRNSEVQEIKPDAKVIPEDVKVLILMHPKGMSDSFAYAVDQFVLGGGSVIVAVDPMSRVDLGQAAQMAQMGGQMPETSSDAPKLFQAWDVVYNKSELVGDLTYTVRVNAGGMVTPYPFFMNMDDQVFSKNSPITSKLGSMLIAEGGHFKLKDGSPFKMEALISTSKESGTASAQMAAFMGPADLAKEMKADGTQRVIAAMITGKFKSAFGAGAPADSSTGKGHIAEAANDVAVMVIADTDFLFDGNAVDRIQFGPQVILRPKNDNVNFLANAVETLGGNMDLISIRSRGRIARPFTKVQEIQVDAQKRYQEEEQRLSARINELQKELNDLQAQRAGGSRFTLSNEQQLKIDSFRAEEKAARERRREVRKGLREDIEKLGKRLVAANMLVMPLGIGAFGVVMHVNRGRRRKKGE